MRDPGGVEFGGAVKNIIALAEIEAEMQMVAEGVETVRSARQLAAVSGLEMPITAQVHAVL